jgi:hypothetical protein
MLKSWKFILTVGLKVEPLVKLWVKISNLQKLLDFVWADNSSNFMTIIIIIINLKFLFEQFLKKNLHYKEISHKKIVTIMQKFTR